MTPISAVCPRYTKLISTLQRLPIRESHLVGRASASGAQAARRSPTATRFSSSASLWTILPAERPRPREWSPSFSCCAAGIRRFPLIGGRSGIGHEW